MLSGSNTDIACRFVAHVAQGGQLLFNLQQVRAETCKQLFARFGGYHAAGGPGQQAHIKTCFKVTHGVAEGRLRHAQLGRCTGETALAGDHHK